MNITLTTTNPNSLTSRDLSSNHKIVVKRRAHGRTRIATAIASKNGGSWSVHTNTITSTGSQGIKRRVDTADLIDYIKSFVK